MQTDARLDPATLHDGLDALRAAARPRLARLMGYYRNPLTDIARYLAYSPSASLSIRPYRQFQELGLPTRITGFRHTSAGDPVPAGSVEVQRKEVVVENDIAWRLNTVVDFAVGQMPVITSTAHDPATRGAITAALNQVLSDSGGVGLLQQIVLLGAIHGAVYVMLRPDASLLARLNDHPAATREPRSGNAPTEALSAPLLRLVTVAASRVLPVFSPEVSPASGAPLAACAITSEPLPPAVTPGKSGWLARLGRWIGAAAAPATDAVPETLDLYEPALWRRFVDGALASEGPNPLGFVPLVGYVNQPDPAGPPVPGLGMSDVEPLLALQDELNTRLSDRASRVTLQSFKMYLGKNIEDFATRPVGPGQMWSTDNPDAEIQTFGGDAPNPSEDAHINEIREAMDKISGVTPVAAGLLRGKIGNLTSAVALRVTLIALLARTERKRGSLGLTLQTLCRRILEILDAAGVLATAPHERDIEITWPSAIPENTLERLSEAQLKIALGIPQSLVLAELGYDQLELADPSTLSPKGDTHGSSPVQSPAPEPAGIPAGAADAFPAPGDGSGESGRRSQSAADPTSL